MGIAAIIGAILPLIPLIRGAIKGGESAIGSGNGSEKMELVVSGLRPFFKALQDAGKIPDDFNLDLVESVVETIFGEMKAAQEVGENTNLPGSFKPGTAYPVTIQGTAEFKVT